MQVLVAGYVLEVERTEAQWVSFPNTIPRASLSSPLLSLSTIPSHLVPSETRKSAKEHHHPRLFGSDPSRQSKVPLLSVIKKRIATCVFLESSDTAMISLRWTVPVMDTPGYFDILQYRVPFSPEQVSFGRDSTGNPPVSVEFDISCRRIDLRGFT